MNKLKTNYGIGLLLLWSLLLCNAPIIAADQKAKATLVRGGVSVSINGANWKLRRNDKVSVGSTITTSAKGLVQLVFPDKSMIYLKANSKITLQSFHFESKNAQKDSSVTRLLKGSMRTISGIIGKRNPEKVKYKTPVSTIGIRGTATEISETRVIFDFGQGYTYPNNNPSGRVNVGTGEASNFSGSRIAFRFSRGQNDPASWAKRFSQMPSTQANEHATQGGMNLPDILFTVGMLQQADNFTSGKLHAVIKGFNKNLTPTQRDSLTKFSVQVYPQHAKSILRASTQNKAELGRVLENVLRGMSGESAEDMNEVFQAAADLGITPEQAQDVLNELEAQPEAECE